MIFHIIAISGEKSTTSTLIQKPMLFLFLFLLLRKRLSLFAYHNKYIKIVKECRWKCFKQSANRLLIFNTIVTVSFNIFYCITYIYPNTFKVNYNSYLPCIPNFILLANYFFHFYFVKSNILVRIQFLPNKIK